MMLMVLGAGRMGSAIAADWLRQDDVEEVVIVDQDTAALDAVPSHTRLVKAKVGTLQYEFLDLLREYESELVLSAVPYFLNLMLTKTAIAAGAHFLDLGGNTGVVAGQRQCSEDAADAGVAIIPDCGLAPGLASILVGEGVRRLDVCESAKIRVGGIPLTPKGPLDYELVFSVEGLLNEYLMPTRILRRGLLEEVESVTEVEAIDWHHPRLKNNNLEAFFTSGTSTLPDTFRDKVGYLDQKTIRYAGHADKIGLLRDLGLMSSDPVPVTEDVRATPRKVLGQCLERSLPKSYQDIVLLRVIVEGRVDGESVVHIWELTAFYDGNLSAMQRCTAYPAACIGLMVARGEIEARGMLFQETDIPYDRLHAMLQERGLDIGYTMRQV